MSQYSITKDKIELSVIVLFYYGGRWIETCLNSLQDQSLSRARYEIIMVDNGGSTPSVGKYDGKFNIQILRLAKNYGFAGGNNIALALAGGRLVLLMNQDVIVHYNCLEELIDSCDRNPQAGILSANMLMVSLENSINPRGSPDEPARLYKMTRLGYAFYVTTKISKDLIPVDFVSGNALCFRKSILTDVGDFLFDDRLGSYAEDLDLSLRLKKTAWKMFVCRRAVVYHYRSEAFGGNPAHMLRKFFHVSSNRLLVYSNNLPAKDFVLKLPALILGIPFKVARLDGNRKVNLSKFLIALGCVPFILVYFIIRLFQIWRSEKEKATAET